jgi:phosphoenolpyruvate carboxykinase (GTP)
MWPGFAENSRVLAWIFRRCEGKAEAVETPIGLVPPVGPGGIDIGGLDVTAETMAKLLEVDVDGWKEQLPQMHDHYATFGDKLPSELQAELDALETRLHR